MHHDVTLVGRPDHVRAIQQDGLRISGKTSRTVHLTATDRLPVEGTPDLVLLTVKAYDTRTAAEALAPYGARSLFLSLQNGLGNEETLAEAVPRVLGGTTAHGVTFVRPGEVHHAGVGETLVGPIQGATLQEAETVATAFQESGMACEATSAIGVELWRKAIVNACINPLTALLRVPNGALLSTTELHPVVEGIAEEGVSVAQKHGVDLKAPDVLERVWAIVQATAENRSSMLQDLERGRRTEIDAINGALVAQGGAAGVATPVNALLAHLVRSQETSGGR